MQLPFTTSQHTAQRIQKATLNLSRNVQTFSALVNIEYMRLQPNDWVYVTNSRVGYDAKVFKVASTSLEPYNGGGEGEAVSLVTKLNLVEASAASFDYVFNEYSTPIDDDTGGDDGDNSISPPTGLTLTQQGVIEGTTNKLSIGVNWTNAVSSDISATEVQYKKSTETDYTGSLAVISETTRLSIPGVELGATYNVRARHISAGGVRSDFTSVSNITISDPSSISAPTSWTVDSLPLAVKLSWVNPNNTNLRAIKIYRHTANFTPTDDTYLVETVTGEPNAPMVEYSGRFDGLTAGTTYYFALRAITHNDLHSSFTTVKTGAFSLDSSTVGLSNVTNHTQIKDDGSNAPNILKNDQISISKNSGAVRLTNTGSTTDITLDNSDIGLGNVTNHAQIKDDLSNLGIASADFEVVSSELRPKNTLKNSQISISSDGTLNNAGGGQVTTTGIGAETPTGAQTKVNNRLSSTEKTRLNAGKTPDDSLDLNNANVDKAHVGLSNVTNDAQVKLDLTNAPNAIKNNQISFSKPSTGTLRLNNGSNNDITLNEQDAGFASGDASKLSGVETGATAGARAGVNLKRNNNTVIGDADIITSEGTSDDTENVNEVAKADITGSITGAQTNVANVIQNLASGSQPVDAGALGSGTINTSLLKLDELFLPTSGTDAAGTLVLFGSSMTTVSIGDLGTGPGFYMGTVSVTIEDSNNDDIRGASLHIDLKSGFTTVYTKYWPIGIKEGNQYYDAGDQFGDNNDLPTMHLEFAYFHTANTTLNLSMSGDSNDSGTHCRIKARAVKFGAETVAFNTSSFTSSVTGATASSTQDSGTITVSGFTTAKQVNLSGNSTALVSINGGTFVNAASVGTISANQTLELRLTASATAGTTRSCTVEVGGTSATFSVTTAGTYTPQYSGGGGGGSAGGGFESTNQLV